MRRRLLSALPVIILLLCATSAWATHLGTATGSVDCTKFTVSVSGFANNEPDPSIKFSITLTPAVGSPITINDEFKLFPDANLDFQATYPRKWSDYGITVPPGSYQIIGLATFNTYNGSNPWNTLYIQFTPQSMECVEQPPSDLATFTQGGWGSEPEGKNPGSLLHANFGNVYPNGLYIGGNFKLTFTTAQAITNFLPQGGKSSTLAGNAQNPTTSAAGVFAGQVLALKLNVDFSNAGVTSPGLGSQNIISSPKDGLPNPGALAGYTVAEVLAIANSVLGGNLGALPGGMKISQLNDIVDAINNNYHSGIDNGFLE